MSWTNTPILGVGLVILVVALPLAQGHQGAFKRFDSEGDPELAFKRDSNPFSPYIGTPCPRTDVLWASVEAFHEDEPGETYNGTRVTMRMADLSARCLLETQGQGKFYYYAIEFKPQNWDWFRSWVAVNPDGGLAMHHFNWFEGGNRWGNGCLSCGAEIDATNDTVTFEIPRWLAVPPYEEAFVHTSMDSCLHPSTDLCFSGSPPSVGKHGDVMPNIGTYCFFC